MGASTMRSARLLLAALAVVTPGFYRAAWAQSPTYGLGKTPTEDEIRAWDISISPTGKELPPGSGSAKQGAQIYAQKCLVCHGATGSEGPAPMLIKRQNPPTTPGPCLSPCIRDANVMAMHSPYATTIWDYINRGMPFKQEGSLKPDEVYALTAFILYKNDVIPEDQVLDAQSLPQVKMPNRDGYAIPNWKPGMPRPFSAKP
jgi:S-disulfanyl-L-cysteine oxidoreductase SoxD